MARKPKVSKERQAVLDQLADDETVVLLEPADLDTAIVGLVERFGQPRIVCYDYEKVIAVMMSWGMDHDGAVEYFAFNTIGAWMGDTTPCFLTRVP